jgi:PDZ domain-containing protein
MRRRVLTVVGGAVVTALLALAVLIAPVPYVVTDEGPTVDVLGSYEGTEVIRVDGVPPSVATGQLRMTTIRAEADVTLRQAVATWFADDKALVPDEAVFPPGLTERQVEQRNTAQFRTSQASAATAAARQLGRPVDATIRLDEIGGPSAGLMFALGIVDKVRPEDLTGGRIIAGTGTIDDAGTVGPIGGIPHKLRGAASADATFFLVPRANCAEAVRNAVPGLTTIAVGTLAEAVAALTTLAGGSVPKPCPVG